MLVILHNAVPFHTDNQAIRILPRAKLQTCHGHDMDGYGLRVQGSLTERYNDWSEFTPRTTRMIEWVSTN